MSVRITKKGTKKFTKEEQLSILKEAKSNGVTSTLAKYDLYPATFYYWRRKYGVSGESGLDIKKAKNQDNEIKKLEQENEALKILLAEEQLKGKLKDDLLKKKYPDLRKNL